MFKCSSKNFHKETQTNQDVGPGKYNIQDAFQHKIFGKNAAFNSSEPRNIKLTNSIQSNENVSPVSYQLNNSLNWNKKSFNVMYI